MLQCGMTGMKRVRWVVVPMLALIGSTAGAAYAVAVPSAPRSPSAVVTAISVRLSWQAPSSTGGSAVTAYVVQRYSASLGKWATIARPRATARSYTDVNDSGSPISAGKKYSYRVRALNGVGIGPASATVTATPYAPTAPRSPIATAGLVRVELDWLAPSATGGTPISAYFVQRRDPGSTTWKSIATQPGSLTGYTDVNDTASPVAAGSAYSYRVLARNAGGTSAASIGVTATPTGCPSNGSMDLYVDPTATRIGTVPATGVSSPAACAFPSISDAVGAATGQGIGSGGRIILSGGTPGTPAEFTDEEFPLTVPPGVAVTTADDPALGGGGLNAANYVVRFDGTAAYAVDVHGGSLAGVTLANARETNAGTMLICTGDATRLESIRLVGTPTTGLGTVGRGAWVWPGCHLDVQLSTVSGFDRAGIVEEEGASLNLAGSEIVNNLGDGVVVRGTLTGGPAEATSVSFNGDDGIVVERSVSATISNFLIRSNLGNGVEVHPSKTSILQSTIFNNSRSAGWTESQLLFIGKATQGPLLYVPDTDTEEPAYVVAGTGVESCDVVSNRISGYSPSVGAAAPGLRAADGAVVDARGNSWSSPSNAVTVGIESYVVSDPPCASVLQPPPD